MNSEKYQKIAILIDTHILCNRYVSCENPRIIYTIDRQLADLVCEKFGLHCKISIIPEFGHLNSDGNWSGLVGAVHRGEADLAVTTIGLTEERVKAVNFSYPFSVSEISFITKKPQYVHDIWTLTYPFSVEIWVVLLMCFPILSFVLYLVNKKKISFNNIALDVIRPLFQQALITLTKKKGNRMIILVWLISMTFISYCYSGLLLSFMVLPQEKGVHNIKELSIAIVKDGYKCAAYPDTYFPETLQSSTDRSAQIIGNNILWFTYDIPHVLLNPQPTFAFIAPRTDFAYLENLYYISDDIFFSMYSAFAVGKKFCCKKRLNILIHRLNAAGLVLNMYEKEIFFRSLSYINYKYTEFTSKYDYQLNLKDISGAFLFLICGYTLSLLVLLIELFISYAKK